MSDIFFQILQQLPSDLQCLIITDALIDSISSRVILPYWDKVMQVKVVELMGHDTVFDDLILCSVVKEMKLRSDHVSCQHLPKLVNFICDKSIKIKKLFLKVYADVEVQEDDENAVSDDEYEDEYEDKEANFLEYPMSKELIQYGCQEVVIKEFPFIEGFSSNLFYLKSISSTVYNIPIERLKTLFTKEKLYLQLTKLTHLRLYIRDASDARFLESITTDLRNWNKSSRNVSNIKISLYVVLTEKYEEEDNDDDESYTQFFLGLSSFLPKASDLNIELRLDLFFNELKYPLSQNIDEFMCSNTSIPMSISLCVSLPEVPQLSKWIRQNLFHKLEFSCNDDLSSDPHNHNHNPAFIESASLKRFSWICWNGFTPHHAISFINCHSLKVLELTGCALTPDFFKSIPNSITELHINDLANLSSHSISLPTSLRILKLMGESKLFSVLQINNIDQLVHLTNIEVFFIISATYETYN
ncbi:unnamed protein product [Ambrosiozyma monospora]|uniref:Unnamed protein product n=1 Tax=Ambrosiozyma monospora TaxID=43982 RepID=A0ACB5T8P1_AMBMO|nr:unnamed protein product [Ambrosiozyma monospora]